MPKNPHAVILGRRGGRQNTPAQAAARAQNMATYARQPRAYRLTSGHLERRQGGQWLRLEPPLDRNARRALRRLRAKA